jgi:putative ABC transport system permease protein
MFKNYLLIGLRNLIKNRVYAIINILGLGIALSVCIVAYFNYAFDANFDRIHENFDSIYRVTSFRDMEGREQEYGLVPAALASEVKNEIPGIDNVSRLFRSRSPVKVGNELFSRDISYVDPAFFDIFTIPMVSGAASTLEDRNNIIISEKLAGTLYGDAEPLGKSLIIVNDAHEEYIYLVTGVFADFPDNTSFRFDILSHADNFMSMWKINDTDWVNWATVMFVQIDNPAMVSAIEESFDRYIPIQNRAREDFIINRFRLLPLKDVGDNSRDIWSGGLFPALHPAAAVSPPIMAFLILLIACFNFANTSIASMGRRLKEIGMRKIFGGFRKQLLVQFLLESLLICTLATLVGIAIGRFLVPAYSSLWEYMTLTMTLAGHWNFILFLLLLLLTTGFLSGVYPALYVSSLNPLEILRSKSKFGKTGLVSNILLTLQFTISIMAIVMGTIFIKNSEYQDTLDMGFDRDKLIVVTILQESFDEYKEAVIDNPIIESVAGTQQHIGFGYYRRPLKYNDRQLEVDVMDIGPNYASTMGLRLVDGRLFDELRVDADRHGSIVINEQFVKDLEWDNPIGKTLTLYDTTLLTVIGVVEDYYSSGLWAKTDAGLLRLAQRDEYFNMAVRASPDNLPLVLNYLRETWQKLYPSYVFTGMYQEETMQEGKDINDSIAKINLFLAIVATVLSMIGIYSLVSLSILHRTKEIGIRNVVGTPVLNMIFLLSKRFLIILAIASILGSAGGYYMSLMLLDSIWDYFLDISAWMLLFSILIMFAATALTITGKTYNAATQNPVKAIQTE